MKQVSWWRMTLMGTILAAIILVVGSFSPTMDFLGKPLRVEDRLQRADVVVAISAGLLNDCKAHPNLFLREGYAAILTKNGYSRSGKLLISGQYTDGKQISVEACRMKLAKMIRINPKNLILDNAAQTTLDNAVNTRALMKKHGWRKILLVTSRSHMMRSSKVFQKQGIRLNPVSIPDMPPYRDGWFDANRLSHIQRFVYEYGALLKYKWYGYI